MSPARLAQVIGDHGVHVVFFGLDYIVVETRELDTRTGEVGWVRETVKATVKDVRDFLGY